MTRKRPIMRPDEIVLKRDMPIGQTVGRKIENTITIRRVTLRKKEHGVFYSLNPGSDGELIRKLRERFGDKYASMKDLDEVLDTVKLLDYRVVHNEIF